MNRIYDDGEESVGIDVTYEELDYDFTLD